MTFRHEIDALRMRRDALRRDIASATTPRREALEAELAHVAARLDEQRHGLARFVVHGARGAHSCPAPWAGMVGDGAVRECGLCDRKVYDFAGLTALEATRLVLESEGALCARLFRRKDGKLLTADCGPGRRRHRRRLTVLGAAAAAVTGAVAVTGGFASPAPPAPTANSLERAMQERAALPWRAPSAPSDPSDVEPERAWMGEVSFSPPGGWNVESLEDALGDESE
ncbi:MAG: hypothetical protein RLP09_43865 [Sandaracinaceae bacterium]|nr:hypothetical protein [Myxococcales bacterium]